MESDKGIGNCMLCGKTGYDDLVIENTREKLFFDRPDCVILYKRFISIYGAEFLKFLGFAKS